MDINMKVYDNVITIYDSYLMTKKEFMNTLYFMRRIYTDNKVLLNRNNYSLLCEWAAHKLLFKLGLFKDRTKDVDLNLFSNIFIDIAYYVFGTLSLIFIK